MSLIDYVLAQQWAMLPETFERCVDVLNRHFAGLKLNADEVAAAVGREPGADHPATRSYEVRDGVALVPVTGVIAKYAHQVNGSSQPRGTSAELLQKQLRAAAADPQVNTILLITDSPGGTVAGTPDTGALIRQIDTTIKPVVAHIGDLGASAGYWLPSQARTVIANRNALVGSIGVISAMYDSSAHAEKQGVKVHVVRSVALKAAGQYGEAINSAQLADAQRVIDALHAQFVAAVTGARPQIKATGLTGQVFTADAAMELGLIDSIASLDQVISDLAANPPTLTTAAGTHPMSVKIAVAALTALIIAHSDHAALIGASAEAGDDEAAILGKITAAKAQAKDAQITDLQAQLAAAATAKAEAITAAKAEAAAALTAEQAAHAATKDALAKLTAQHAALSGLAGSAATDPGQSAGDLKGLNGETLYRAEFAASDKLRAEFFGNEKAYIGFRADEDKAKRSQSN
jgi:signal peptide peptidase SppA